MAGCRQMAVLLLLSVLMTSVSGMFFFSRNSNVGDDLPVFGNAADTPFNPDNTENNAQTPFSNTINNNDNNKIPGNNYPNNNNNNNYNSVFGGNAITSNNVNNNDNDNSANNRCVQRSARDFRAHPYDCAKFTMCSRGNLLTFDCPKNSVFHEMSGSCVPQGSYYDKCSSVQASQLVCPPGATYKKAHPQHCARYYHCGQPPQMRLWENHLKECEYPHLFNDITKKCEHYSMVNCGTRYEPFDRCEYRANTCESHSQCVPCKVRYPSCRGKPDGMNSWKGREGSPYYTVCANQRVVYDGMCSQQNGVQVFDEQMGVCKYLNGNPW